MIKDVDCERCGGEGRIWKSKYGGNDPDVWDAGECPVCEGTGSITVNLLDEVDDDD